ncbi:MAG: hypothetical protein KC589_09505 [Nanoarchaeota archaeon]|nr:hypothetical protein [Nanoarchaeota archaeon]
MENNKILKTLKIGSLVTIFGTIGIITGANLSDTLKQIEFEQIRIYNKKNIDRNNTLSNIQYQDRLLTQIYGPTSMWLDGGNLFENLRKKYTSGECKTCNSFDDYLLEKICDRNSYYNSMKRFNELQH